MDKTKDQEIWESSFADKNLVESFKTKPGPALPPKSQEQVLMEKYVKEQTKLSKEVDQLKEKVEKILKYVKLNIRGLDAKLNQQKLNVENIDNTGSGNKSQQKLNVESTSNDRNKN